MSNRGSMKPLGAVLALLKPANDQPVVPKPKQPPEGYQPPTLPPDLRHQVDQLAGRCRYGDFVMQPSEPRQHPDAVRYAAEMQWALEPAPAGLIRKWLTMLAGGLGFPGDDPDRLNASIEFHIMCNGDLPARCWTKETLILAGNKLTFWPKPAEINALLEPIAEEIRRDLNALDTIAKAERRASSGPARPAPERAPEPAPPQRDAHPSAPKYIPPGDDMEPAPPSPQLADLEAEFDRQLKALNMTREQVAALPQRVVSPQEPKP